MIREERIMDKSIETKKEEAVSRMKRLGLPQEMVRQFEQDGYIGISESPVGAFYWAEGEDLQHIRNFEADYNALVYVVIRSFTTIGKIDSYLYVSNYPEEWEYERKLLDKNTPSVYVYNHNAPECSELGEIGIRRSIEGRLLQEW